METYSSNSENNFKFYHNTAKWRFRRGLQTAALWKTAMFVLITSGESTVDRRSHLSSLNLNCYLFKKKPIYIEH